MSKLYFPGDQLTPEISEAIALPEADPFLSIVTDGFTNIDDVSPIACQAANCTITLRRLIKYFRSLKEGEVVKKWASASSLCVIPRAGEQLNAYYSRGGIRYYFSKLNDITIYLVDSQDVVAHEMGHALLDAIRPDLWDAGNVEIVSIHEAFADITALVSASLSSVIREKTLEETNANLQTSNQLSRIADYIGNVFYQTQNDATRKPTDPLRDLAIPFHYVSPSTLPLKAKYIGLAAEPHSFSKIFSSFWYRVFTEIYNDTSKTNSFESALITARDICYRALIKSLKKTKGSLCFVEAVAFNFVLELGEHSALAKNLFLQWDFKEQPIFNSLAISAEIEYIIPSQHRLLASSENPFLRSAVEIHNFGMRGTSETVIDEAILAAEVANIEPDKWNVIEGKLRRIAI